MIFTICTLTTIGQKLAFKNELVDTIKITSLISVYQFDKNGTTLGTFDEFTIKYSPNDKCYKVHSYFRTTFKGSFKYRSYRKKKNSVKTFKNNIVSNTILNELFTGLITNESPLVTYSYIDSITLKQYVNEKTFYKIFKSYDTMYIRLFEESIPRKLIKAQSIDSFKSYLTRRFNDTRRVTVTDYSNSISIYITTGAQKYQFIGEFPHKLKQPWFIIPDSGYAYKYILNFNINNSLTKILPPQFNQLNTITLEALMYDYMLKMMPGSYE